MDGGNRTADASAPPWHRQTDALRFSPGARVINYATRDLSELEHHVETGADQREIVADARSAGPRVARVGENAVARCEPEIDAEAGVAVKIVALVVPLPA